MTNTIRIYGKEINTWMHIEKREDGREYKIISQRELEYEEYDLNGNLISAGTEDFSRERYRNELISCQVCTWDGLRLNKGGHRWFEFEGIISIIKSQRKDVMKYLKKKYAESEIVQLRKI